MRKPPLGMIARLSGASVWSPTTISSSCEMYPGACDVMVDGVLAWTS